MNPAPHRRHANIAQQLADLLGTPARAAGLVPMISIFNLGEPEDYRVARPEPTADPGRLGSKRSTPS
jgi:hypothetical protein